MHNIGMFDFLIAPKAWFDPTQYTVGWFNEDYISSTTSTAVSNTLMLLGVGI